MTAYSSSTQKFCQFGASPMKPCFDCSNRSSDDPGDLLVRQILFMKQHEDQSIIRAESSEGTFELARQVIGIGQSGSAIHQLFGRFGEQQKRPARPTDKCCAT